LSMPSYYGLAKSIFGMDLLKKQERKLAESFTRLILGGLRAARKPARRRNRPLFPESHAGNPVNA